MKLTHANLKKAATEYLEAKGYLVCNFYAGGFQDKKGKWFPRKNTKGISDLICCSPKTGHFFALEIKIGKDTCSPEQENFLKNVIACGGMAFIIYSIDDLISWLE